MVFDLGEATEVLERTPAALAALLGGLADAWVRADEGPDTWSPFDVVGHLIQGERCDWLPRVRHILEHGESTPFTPFDRFAQFEASKGSTLAALLDEFAALRARSLRDLSALRLSSADMDRAGTHPAFGRVTLGQLLSTWTVHDLGHVAQICRAMAGRYHRDVGPWAAYLPIVAPRR